MTQPGAEVVAGLADALLVASPDAAIVVDRAGRIVSASAACTVMFGYRPEELIGQDIEILLPEAVRAAHVGYRTSYSREPRARAMGIGLELSARRRDGTTLAVDVSLAPVAIGEWRGVGAFVRDVTERRKTEVLLRNINGISRAILAGRSVEETLALTAGDARALVGAVTSWIVTPGDNGDLVVTAADGEGAAGLIGARLDPSSSYSARTMTARRTITVEALSTDPGVLVEARRLELGPGAYLPLVAEQGAVGALVVARRRGEPAFEPADLSLAEVFASAAGVVLALGRARRELEEVQITAEHERIARDLHDTVIQHLFAIGMGLQGVRRYTEGTVAARIDQAVEALDSVIRDIRETIFDLNRPVSDQPDLRQRIQEIVADATQQLGFPPHVGIRGPVETLVDEALAIHLLAVLREALSNAARHSQASRVEVVVSTGNGSVALVVTDDGVGLPATPRRGNGLANMAERARQLGGQLEVQPGNGRGTEVVWRVPLGPAGEDVGREARGGVSGGGPG